MRTCDAPPVVLDLVPVHAHLVAADDGLQPVLLAEPLGNIRTELHADSTLTGAAASLLLRVCPQHLHHQTRLAGLSLVVPVKLSDIVEGDIVIGEEATVEYEVLPADECGQG